MDTRKLARDINTLEPEALISLFTVSYDAYNPDAMFYFHGGMNLDADGIQNGIVFGSQTYLPMPIEESEFEVSADQTVPRPKLKISNHTFLISQILRRYNRLLNAKVTRKKVFVKYLDSINFVGSINPYGVPDSSGAGFETETFYVNRIAEENKYFVTLELASSLDLENIKLPNRQILARYCSWCYRGGQCGYSGPPKKTERDADFTDSNGAAITNLVNRGQWQEGISYSVGDYVSRPTKNVLVRGANPTETTFVQAIFVCRQAHTSSANTNPFLNSLVWVRDGCGKRLNSCRFHFDGTLPFGGFLGTSSFSG